MPTTAQINEVISKRSRDRWVVLFRTIDRRPGVKPGFDFYTNKCNYYTKRDAVAAVKEALAKGAIINGHVVQYTYLPEEA